MKKPVIIALSAILGYSSLALLPVAVPQAAAAENSDSQSSNKRVRRSQTMRPVIFNKLDAVRAKADEKQYAEALDELASVEKIRRNSYEQAMTFNMYAYVYFNQEDYAGAIKAYEQVVAIDSIPESLEQTTLYSLAKLYLIQEDYKKSLVMLNKWFAVVEKPGPEAYILRAQMQFQLEQYGKALPDVKKAIALVKEQGNQPKENWLMLERAVYYQNKDFNNLARCLQDLATLYPKPQYWTQLAAVYSELNKPLKELSTLETAYDQGYLKRESDLISLAYALMGQDIPYKAANILEKGLKDEIIKPTAKNLSTLGDAWMLAKEYDKAIVAMTKAAGESQKGSDFFKLAQIHTERQEWKLALNNVNAALKDDDFDKSSNAYILKGNILFNMNDLNGARQSFAAAEKFPEAEKTAAQWLAFVEAEQKRREYMGSVN